MKQITLSKTQFIKGTQCLKALYLHYHNPELKTPLFSDQKMVLERGKEVGVIGRNIYPDGIDLSNGGTVLGKALIETTKDILKQIGKYFMNHALNHWTNKCYSKQIFL